MNTKDWNWRYKKNQQKIWLDIDKSLTYWKKDGFQDPITYFTDGLNRWIALEINKEKQEIKNEFVKFLEMDLLKEECNCVHCEIIRKKIIKLKNLKNE